MRSETCFTGRVSQAFLRPVPDCQNHKKTSCSKKHLHSRNWIQTGAYYLGWQCQRQLPSVAPFSKDTAANGGPVVAFGMACQTLLMTAISGLNLGSNLAN